jgi:nucleoside-diphosphate-sugar epimerase
MDKSKVLIVGGAGFAGSNLAHYLLENYDIGKLYIIDNLISADISNVPIQDNVEFIYGSITSDRILNQIPENLDYVFHLSCYHGNQSSIADPLADHENNTLTTLKLFEKIKSIKSLKKVVYAAAGCAVAVKTFDEPEATLEDAPVSLFHDSPYSISKLIGEMYGNYYFRRHGLPFCKARFQNVYGPREILGAGNWRGTVHTVWRNVIPTFVWRSIHHEALPLDNGGNASRDFIFVKDLVKGLIAIAQKGEQGEAYNLASGVETSILDLSNLINEITQNPTPVDLRPARDWDTSGKRFGSTVKSKEKLGFEAEVNIKDGLQDTINWTLQNKGLIAETMKRFKVFIPELSKY